MNKFNQSILITGVGGFIGSEVAKAICKTDSLVIGIDNMNIIMMFKEKKIRKCNKGI